MTAPIEIFYSYAHEDEDLRNQLDNHLSSLKQQNLISGWYDRDISAGALWSEEIQRHLRSARIILLLVSRSFLASKYCYEVEIQEALRRHEFGEALLKWENQSLEVGRQQETQHSSFCMEVVDEATVLMVKIAYEM